MAKDIKSMSRKDLEKLAQDIEKQLEKLKTQELKQAREAAEKAAAALGFSLSDLVGTSGGARKTRKPRAKDPKAGIAKYADPADPSRTWTGKGRQPQWFKDALAAGKTPETFPGLLAQSPDQFVQRVSFRNCPVRALVEFPRDRQAGHAANQPDLCGPTIAEPQPAARRGDPAVNSKRDIPFQIDHRWQFVDIARVECTVGMVRGNNPHFIAARPDRHAGSQRSGHRLCRDKRARPIAPDIAAIFAPFPDRDILNSGQNRFREINLLPSGFGHMLGLDRDRHSETGKRH